MILALDTSGEQTLVALGNADKYVGEASLGGKEYVHSKSLFPEIEEILSGGGYSVEDLTAIAVSLGPGSFTGVRIGVVAGKTLAQILGIPIMGLSILEVLARGVLPYKGFVFSSIDARRNEIFGALYVAEGQKLSPILSQKVGKPEALLGEIADKTGSSETVVLGSGVLQYRLAFKSMIPGAQFLPLSENNPKGTAMLEIAIERFGNNDFDELYSLVPNYLRVPDAERNILKMKKVNG